MAVLAEWGPGDEGNVVLLAEVEEEVELAVGKAVAVLHRDDGDDFQRALEVFEGDVGERDMLDPALIAQAGEVSTDASNETAGSGIWSC